MEVDRLEDPDVAGDGQRVLPDEQVLVGLEAVHRVAGPDTDHAIVGLDPHERDREEPPRHGVPGGRERRLERHDEALQPDGADLHDRSIADRAPLPWPSPTRRPDPPAADPALHCDTVSAR